MRNKIAQRLTLYFAAVLLVFALLSGTLFSLMFARHTADVTSIDIKDHAESIAGTLSHFIGSYNSGDCSGSGFKSYVRFIGEAATGDLFLLDADCQPAALGEMKLPELPIPEQAPALVKRVFQENEVVCESFYTRPFHAHNLFAAAPVHDLDGNVLYVLLLQAPLGSIDHTLRDAFYILASSLCIAGVLGILGSYILSRRLVTPLHKMMRTTTQLMQGYYSAKTDIHQHDEIGVLAGQIDELANRLDEAQEERRQLDQMRQDFFSDISHELRTPISVIKGNVELLCENMIGEGEQRLDHYRQLYRDIGHIEHLVNDLLELTRLQNPHFNIQMEPINLIGVLEESVRFMRQRAEEKQILVRLENDVDLFAVLGDYMRLRQLMIILLDNAIKFSPAHAEVVIAAKRTGDRCIVSVTDHGVGIEQEAIEHIFDRFFHSASSRNCTGTGLGLPIAKEIAQRHQLTFTCESTPGKETRFSLVFSEHPVLES